MGRGGPGAGLQEAHRLCHRQPQVLRLGGGRDGGHLPPVGGQDRVPAQAVGLSGQAAEGGGRDPDGGLGLPQLPRDGQDQVSRHGQLCFDNNPNIFHLKVLFWSWQAVLISRHFERENQLHF